MDLREEFFDCLKESALVLQGMRAVWRAELLALTLSSGKMGWTCVRFAVSAFHVFLRRKLIMPDICTKHIEFGVPCAGLM